VNLAAVEMNDTTFYGYATLLVISGVIMLVLAAAGFGASTGSRVLSGVLGLGFLGYGVYLFLFFNGGTVHVIYYVFAAPILLIINVVKSRRAAKEGMDSPQYTPGPSAAPPYSAAPQYPGAPQQGPAPYYANGPQQPPAPYGAPQQPVAPQYGAPQQSAPYYPTGPQQPPAPQYPGAPQPQYPAAPQYPGAPQYPASQYPASQYPAAPRQPGA
jgi:hypothetical protein